MGLNFQGGWPSKMEINIRGDQVAYIYRENYSMYGKKICKMLKDQFGGPECHADGAAAWNAACKDAKSRGRFRDISTGPVSCGPANANRGCKHGEIKPCENE